MIYTMLQTILTTLLNFISDVNSNFININISLQNYQSKLNSIELVQQEQTKLLEQILQQLQPPPATGIIISFVSNESQEEKDNMTNKAKATKAGVDFQLLDNGTATATVSFVDSVGNPTSTPVGAAPAVYTSSNPAVVSVGATNADGVSATLTPLSLGTGVIVSATVTVTDPTGVNPPVTLSGSGNPIDVIAGAASALAISEA
jgi:hypothetical protein